MENGTPFKSSLSKWFSRKRVLGVAVFLIAYVFAIFLVFKLGRGNSGLTTLGYDMIKLAIQLLLIVLFGGVFIQEYNRARARKDAVYEFRRAILKDLSRAYSDAKGARRILRARCERTKNDEDCIPLPLYDEHIATINETQLELEIMRKELRIIRSVFKKIDELICCVKHMERYLGAVFTEYETKVKDHRGAVSIPLSTLPRLQAFLAKSEDTERSDFPEFSESYRKALTIIQEERVKVS